jgi:hypothetical protein
MSSGAGIHGGAQGRQSAKIDRDHSDDRAGKRGDHSPHATDSRE